MITLWRCPRRRTANLPLQVASSSRPTAKTARSMPPELTRTAKRSALVMSTTSSSHCRGCRRDDSVHLVPHIRDVTRGPDACIHYRSDLRHANWNRDKHLHRKGYGRPFADLHKITQCDSERAELGEFDRGDRWNAAKYLDRCCLRVHLESHSEGQCRESATRSSSDVRGPGSNGSERSSDVGGVHGEWHC